MRPPPRTALENEHRGSAPRGGLRLFYKEIPYPLMPHAPEGRGRPHLIPRLRRDAPIAAPIADFAAID
jgi:hypothetical protein